MQDQVAMSRKNGALCIAIPLYRMDHNEKLASLGGYVFTMHKDKPLMYALDLGAKTLQAFNAEWVEKNLKFLGEL